KNAVVIAPGRLDRSATGAGIAELYLDPDDPFPEGYLLSDTWPGDDVQ
ncbi:MAG: hypothetical protein QOH16_3310, partial [Gaiellaceae bacterium]|nr:hypothetical protein [Gaiellaceae bacterium]